MIIDIDVLLDYGIPERHDVLLQVEAAAMADQRLLESHLTVTSPERLRAVEGEESIGQRTWAAGLGQFRVEYRARVAIDRAPVDLSNKQANDPRMLPALVVPYLLPSRYCESDKFEAFVTREFSHVGGGQKIMAMLDWMATHVDYVSGSSSGDTTAAGTFVQRQGVCRDFAHLLASMSRAAMIPARLVAAYAPGVTPPDFHAVVEIWLDGSWHLVDATGMAKAEEIVRIGVGRDATDIAFMTVFGSAQMFEQRVTVTRG
ncbi:MAG: transglutaminase family protein [Sphingomonadales bacterium]|jgi:transglutaminase-like putative cysteine protease|nr:transglutaminase family protein [Sphingomonadales bacterium]